MEDQNIKSLSLSYVFAFFSSQQEWIGNEGAEVDLLTDYVPFSHMSSGSGSARSIFSYHIPSLSVPIFNFVSFLLLTEIKPPSLRSYVHAQRKKRKELI